MLKNKIKKIQNLLKTKGFNCGLSDGILGDKTEKSIIEAISILPNVNAEPNWLENALRYIGLKEIQGIKHNPKILEFWQKIGVSFKDDETPWCAGFVGGVLEEVGVKSSRSAAARSYMTWGVELPGPAVGSVVTFWRGNIDSWHGHVGFVVGKDYRGHLMVLGGNQGNEVCIKPFNTWRVLSYSWPEDFVKPSKIGFDKLPVVESNGKVSSNEL